MRVLSGRLSRLQKKETDKEVVDTVAQSDTTLMPPPALPTSAQVPGKSTTPERFQLSPRQPARPERPWKNLFLLFPLLLLRLLQ